MGRGDIWNFNRFYRYTRSVIFSNNLRHEVNDGTQG